ncbi:MAG: tetratricopeptide repeat protein [Candidatus Sulfotelmatobacter sp.]
MAETYTNDSGMTEFSNLEIGNYHLIISGQGVQETDSGVFEVDPRRVGQTFDVTVRRAQDDDAEHNPQAGGTVNTSDQNIPKNAAEEFDKATVLMGKKEWNKAIEHLHRALAIYPQYAAAYNNLGVIYANLGDRPREREALGKAISLNDHFAPAFVNLARMAIADRDMPEAASFLNKATAADPTNAQTLVLLANVELLLGHYDPAIASCRKAHSLSQDSHALAHYIAARAFEHQSRVPEAVDEFQTFLKEEPTGKRSESVRKELSHLQGLPH